MTTTLSRLIQAPIDEVFAFFDDPGSTLEFNPHAEQFEVVDQQPDGRRTYDVVMRSDAKEWMQTVEQVLREPPTRLVTRGGSWTSDRERWLLTITTDRRFSVEGDGTRVDVTIESKLDRPLRRPVQALRNWLWRGAASQEFEHQLALIAKRLETQHRPAANEVGPSDVAPTPPLVVFEGPSYQNIFGSVQALLEWVEAIDVRNDEYTVFDGDARRVRLAAEADDGPVTAELASAVGDRDELRALLADLVRQQGQSQFSHVDADVGLDGLLQAVWQREHSRRPFPTG